MPPFNPLGAFRVPAIRSDRRRGGAAPAPPYSPPTAFGADLGLWLDASNVASVTIATGVSQWNDLSGAARHMTQGAGANQPAYTSGVSVDFDGSNDFLENASPFMVASANGFSLWAVMTPLTGMATSTFILGESSTTDNDTANYPLAVGTSSNLGRRVFLRNDASTSLINTDTAAQWTLDAITMQGYTDSLTVPTLYKDGAATTLTSYARSGVFTACNRIAVGALVRASVAAFSKMRLHEIVAVNRVITAGERTDLETYLRAKWGTP